MIEPDEGIVAIGSAAGSYALAAARALMENTELGARDRGESLKIAGQICIYTNDQLTIEELK